MTRDAIWRTEGLGARSCSALRQLDTQTQTMSKTVLLKAVYDKLLGSVRLTRATGSGNTILVTSAHVAEGSTTVASNLAIAASLAGFSVLLISGAPDTRVSECAQTVGFTDVLSGSATADEACFTSDVEKDGLLRVMLPGTTRPALLPSIDWARARETVRSISKNYHMTVIDAPPVLSSSDALLLAGLVDGVLLVVDSTSAHRDGVRRARDQLQQVNTPIIGAVLNRTDPVATEAFSA